MRRPHPYLPMPHALHAHNLSEYLKNNECRVLVTERIRPLELDGTWVHQIGLPYHWGVTGRTRGSGANDLLPFVADHNTDIQESKALTCDIVAGRQATGVRAAAGGTVPALPPEVQEVRRDSPLAGEASHVPWQEKKGEDCAPGC